MHEAQNKPVIYGRFAWEHTEMDEIRHSALDHSIAIIEDAAETFGLEFHGKNTGNIGETKMYSFYWSKTMKTDEGWIPVTDRKALYDLYLVLRNHGRTPGEKMFWNAEVNYKYKMSSMQAALGHAQLESIEAPVDRKWQIFPWYRGDLPSVEGITLNSEPSGTKIRIGW